MYSLSVDLMITQSIQAERNMEIDYHQMIQTVSARKTERSSLGKWLVKAYLTIFEKRHNFPNYTQDESKVVEYS